MSSSSSSAPAARQFARPGVLSLLIVTAALWLLACWAMLRLEPADMALAAGAVVMFAAVTEVIRSVAGGRAWWLHAGLAALFALTAAVIMADGDGALTTPAALVGWCLLVRGAVDVATCMLNRSAEPAWPLALVLGSAQVALGFWASSSLARTSDRLVLVLAALALARGIGDLMTMLGMRLGSAAAQQAEGMEQPLVGADGYAAGMTDYAASTRASRPRHRAAGHERAEQPGDAAELTATLDAAALATSALPTPAYAGLGATVPSAAMGNDDPVRAPQPEAQPTVTIFPSTVGLPGGGEPSGLPGPAATMAPAPPAAGAMAHRGEATGASAAEARTWAEPAGAMAQPGEPAGAPVVESTAGAGGPRTDAPMGERPGAAHGEHHIHAGEAMKNVAVRVGRVLGKGGRRRAR